MAGAEGLRILCYGLEHRQRTLAARFEGSGMQVDCTNRMSEVPRLLRQQPLCRVLVVPAEMKDEEWWVFWGDVCLLDPRPAILVYSKAPTFELWAGVLEAGGYDVIVEPFSDEELEMAVLRAADSLTNDA